MRNFQYLYLFEINEKAQKWTGLGRESDPLVIVQKTET